jgi:hypothetical protein
VCLRTIRAPLPEPPFWFYMFLELVRRTAADRSIGIAPPRQRPGYTLGPNLSYAQVSLSRRMRHGHKCCQHVLIAWMLFAPTVRWSSRTCNLAFPPRDMRGTYRICSCEVVKDLFHQGGELYPSINQDIFRM